MKRFLNRERELALLAEVFDRAGAQFVVLYGRRRIGKTALLMHWRKQQGAQFLYWMAHPSSSGMLLRSFSKAIRQHLPSASGDFVYTDWEAFDPGVHSRGAATVCRRAGRVPLFARVRPGIGGPDPEAVGWTLRRFPVGVRCFRLTLSHDADEVGRIWKNDVEIDAAAVNRRDQRVIVGECKWTSRPIGPAVLDGLIDRSGRLTFLKDYHVQAALFAKAGFTSRCHDRAARENVLLFEGPQLQLADWS